jgi:hypothetical protein
MILKPFVPPPFLKRLYKLLPIRTYIIYGFLKDRYNFIWRILVYEQRSKRNTLELSQSMAILDIFKKKVALVGNILLRSLPPHKMYSVTVTFFPVAAVSSPPPFNSDPPIDKWVDTASVKKDEDPDDKPLLFKLQRVQGYYYIGVSVIAIMERDGKMYAQVERFFPMTRPCEIRAGVEQQVQVAVSWPDIPFDELHTYSTAYPAKR